MNVVLIVRAELVCIVILLYLFFFSLRYWENEEKKRFLRMCICALGHVTFDMITVYTVNHLETIPLWINNLLHMVFYEFAIVFCYEFLCYEEDLLYLNEKYAEKAGKMELAYVICDLNGLKKRLKQ